MVLGNIKNAEHYYSINPFIREGVEFLLKNIDAPAGRYEIRGEDCFLTIVEGTKRDRSEAKLEVHNRYVDVQFVLKGTETFGYKARVNCEKLSGEFDSTSDIGFFEDAPTTYVDGVEGDMLIFFPADGHAPLVGQGVVRKAILKVRY